MNKSILRVICCFGVLSGFMLVFHVAGGGSSVAMRSRLSPPVPPSTSSPTLVPVVTNLSTPVYVTNAHDGTNRLFILEQGGVIKVLQPGSSSPTVFLNISSAVLFGGEQGLLGLAFHPAFQTNRRFFVNYTRMGDGATVIAEYHASASNPNVADITETVILTISQPFANHNGGMIEFGPDGFLYIGMGDGGSGNDPGSRAQNIDELLGKILRIDINQSNGAVPYSSPPGNPFFGATPGRDEIYAVGMRNPWRFSFDRGTGQLYVADVGQDAREEVDIVTLGGNYGWRVYEGTLCTNLDPALCNPNNFVFPIDEYSHTPGTGGRCSIIGGYVYRGAMSALPLGTYVYGDLCTGEIFSLHGGVRSLLFDTNFIISSFGEDEAGELYVVELGNSIYRIVNQAGPGRNDTIGLYDPAHAAFFVRNSNTSGIANSSFSYGPAGAGRIPIVGNWNGDGVATIGLYDPTHAAFFLRNSNTAGVADISFTFGPVGSGLIPLVGDWNGDGIDTIGLYDPAQATFSLRNSNSSGGADISFTFGPAGLGWIPLVGDWNGDGIDTIGLYDPTHAAFFLRNSNTTGVADVSFSYGPAGLGWIPLAGDWNGDGFDTIGLYDPSHASIFLKNSNTSGVADITFTYGPSGAGFVPLANDWDGL